MLMLNTTIAKSATLLYIRGNEERNMALSDRFRNKSNKDILPEEVEEYYQSEHRERRGVAILLGIFTLVVTLAVAALIFFGTRAIYRSISGSDKSSNTSDSPKKDTKTSNNGSQTPSAVTAPSNSQTTNPPSNTSSTSSTSNSTTPGTAKPTTPATGDDVPLPSTGDLPRTGDPGL